jgi:conjugative relaxase-like TrwC/TraI family protein
MNPSVPPTHGPPSPAVRGVLGVTKIGTRNVGYWINSVAQGGEDYYSKPGEAPGVWQGRLAGDLGLSGEVDHDDYMAIFAGRHPRTGASLVDRSPPRRWIDAAGRNRKADPVLGYDLRFAAPKSVSLVWAIGDEEARATMLAAHEKGVEEALRYLEDVACWVQRGKGGKKIEKGTGFVGMGFLHRSSRAGDPALHTHMLISNMTRSAKDGEWLSLASPKGRTPLFLHAKAAGHIYQAVLRAEVTRELGLGWGEVTNGHADLLGFDRDLIEHFSRRRGEIVEYMAERGVTSAAAAEVAAYRTRAAKDYGVDADRQRAEWVARGAEFDLTPESIREMITEAVAREPRPVEAEDLKKVLDDLEARHSHFGRRDLVCGISSRMVEGADAGSIRIGSESILGDRRVVGLREGVPISANSNFTTRRLRDMEKRLVAASEGGKEAGASVVDRDTLDHVLQRHDYLGDEQQEMVRRLTTGGERVALVAARPGTGKTTALRAAAEAWAADGFRGIGVATARSATVEIADVGIPATSIAKLRLMLEERAERGLVVLPPGTVIVVDEASTASTEDLAMLLERVVECDGKLVLMGDTRQIGAVAAGGVYGDLAHRLDVIELNEIRRQRDPVDRSVVELAHEGRGSDALDVMQATGRLRVAGTHAEALDALALDWLRDFTAGEDAAMIARRNEDVRRLNEIARALREERGELGERIGVGGQEFAVGDVVMTRVNAPEVSNRERWRIVSVDPRAGSVDATKIGAPAIGVTLEDEYLRRRARDGAPALEHAAATTTYAAQGKTLKARVLLDPGVNREDFLVAVSRSRTETVAYLVAASELEDGELGPATREISDELHDIRGGSERVAGEFAGVEVEPRAGLEAMSAVGLASYRRSLIEELGSVGRPDVGAVRRVALDGRIEAARERLGTLADQRSRLDDTQATVRVDALCRQAERQISRLEEDRAGLPDDAGQKVDAVQSDRWRYDLQLVDERMVHLRRKAVEAERLEPTTQIVSRIGTRPRNQEKVRAWDEGVDLIYGFRLRWGVEEEDPRTLGPDLVDPSWRADRRAVEKQLASVCEELEITSPRVARVADLGR